MGKEKLEKQENQSSMEDQLLLWKNPLRWQHRYMREADPCRLHLFLYEIETQGYLEEAKQPTYEVSG